MGLIAKLALVSCVHFDGTGEVKHFDWFKVGIKILFRGLEKAAFKSAAFFYISFDIPLTNSQLNPLKCARLSN